MNLISRRYEIGILEHLLKSPKPEFLALYGRRRVGKTFLIREFFKDKPVVFFNATGMKNGSMIEQITHFTKQISAVFLRGLELKPATHWQDVFNNLTKAFAQTPSDKKLVIFLDELPWMATAKSQLLPHRLSQ